MNGAFVAVNFRVWLQNEFREREWSNTEAARQIGVSHTVVGDWLDGSRNPSAASLNKIATALRLPPTTVYEAAGKLPPGDAPDPKSQYARMRGLIDAIDWDAHPEWMRGLVPQLEALAAEQARQDAELEAEIDAEESS